MTDQELLQSAHIPPEMWEECLIMDGMIFVPEDDLTAREVYDRFLNPPAELPEENLTAEYEILTGEGRV